MDMKLRACRKKIQNPSDTLLAVAQAASAVAFGDERRTGTAKYSNRVRGLYKILLQYICCYIVIYMNMCMLTVGVTANTVTPQLASIKARFWITHPNMMWVSCTVHSAHVANRQL